MKIQSVAQLSNRFFKSHTSQEVQDALEKGQQVWKFETDSGGSDDLWICNEDNAQLLALDTSDDSPSYLAEVELAPLPETTLGTIWNEWSLDPITDWGFPKSHNLKNETPARFKWDHDSYLLQFQQNTRWHTIDGLRHSIEDVWDLLS